MAFKPNWACGICGMFSSRKESVKRHVRNIHGQGPILRFIDYVTGRQAGYYAPGSLPTFERREPQHVDGLKLDQRAFRDGFWNELGREAVRQDKKQQREK